MRLLALIAAILPMAPLIVVPADAAQGRPLQRPAPECDEWRACMELALDARSQGEYERFHDLAWRTVQTGPPNDPALMYLLARAQSLSNRSRDALVMLRRLAERGVVMDALAEEDFRAARQLPEWAAIEALVSRAARAAEEAAAAALPAPAPPAAPPLPPAPTPAAAAVSPTPSVPPAAEMPAAPAATPAPAAARAAPSFEPRPVDEVSRVALQPFEPGGLAYDAVSRRFLFGDARGRRLMVVGEGTDTVSDFVRAAAARFHDVIAFQIDATRGDLWVASTSRDGDDTGAVHRLQLISGRTIAVIEPPAAFGAVRLVDLAVASSGRVLVLDRASPRVVAVRPGASALEELMPLDVADPVSLTAGGDDRIAYVAHRDGIARLDLQQRRAVDVTAPEGIGLEGFERIRWHRNALIGVQSQPDGSRRVIRLTLNRAATAVTGAAVIDESVGQDGGPTFATISGDDLYYLVTDRADPSTTTGAMEVTVRRLRLP